ncbi:4Fe-4S dicluster domain-containing protein [Candidatus Bathyarchaeota archaeon]|nr:4Fe-4S dicluster domain-containing protein [Candidatus Bathyarchaeota archaeon]
MKHEGWIWPEASRVRVFMPFPGVEVPHLCAQCNDYPCVASCPVQALSTDPATKAVIVDREKCTSCGTCVGACPGHVPIMHPGDNKATICNLCDGDPECVKVCAEAGYNALMLVDEPPGISRRLFSRDPIEVAKELAVYFLGEKGEEVI